MARAASSSPLVSAWARAAIAVEALSSLLARSTASQLTKLGAKVTGATASKTGVDLTVQGVTGASGAQATFNVANALTTAVGAYRIGGNAKLDMFAMNKHLAKHLK